MGFKQFLTAIIILIILGVIIKFSTSDKFDLLYTDPKSILSFEKLVSGYNEIKTETINNSDLNKLQNQITELSSTTNSQSLKDKLMSMFDQTTAVQKYKQVSHCLDLINKLDKLSVDNIQATGLDANTNPDCSTQIKLMKNKIKSLNKQYNQYQTYRAIYMSGLNSCDEIETIYNNIINFNNQVDNFGPNSCDISMPKINLQNIGTNLKNIYTGDDVQKLIDSININKGYSLTGAFDNLSGAITSQFKTWRGKLTNN